MAAGILRSLSNFDAYGKTLDDFRIRTNTGAVVTITSTLIIVWLLLSEFTHWVTPEWETEMVVDTREAQVVTMDFSISLPHLPCFMTSVDMMDATGESHSDVDHDVYKIRIKRDGTEIKDATVEQSDVGRRDEQKHELVTEKKACGDCYGGVPPASGCCNNCADVRGAYQRKGWAFNNPEKIPACVEEGYVDVIKKQKDEGCRLIGHITTPKIFGRIHIAPGKTFDFGSRHVLDLSAFTEVKWDFTHTIERLRFMGPNDTTDPPENIVSGKPFPLEGFTQIVQPKGDQHMQNYIEIVPTKFQYMNGRTEYASVYAASHYKAPTKNVEGANRIPGLIIDYDYSPMLLTYRERRVPFAHFLTDICAIVGGVFTVAGFLDGVLFKADRIIRQKSRIGKLN